MATTNYLDLTGLQVYDGLIKTEIKKYACGMIGGSVYSSLYERADLLTTAET